MARLPRLTDPTPELAAPDRRRRYTRRLFDLVAPRYDRFTRWFSFGMDGRWKRWLAREVARRAPRNAVVLDLACGTGDLMQVVGRSGGQAVAHLIGLDASRAMLAQARRRFADHPIARPSDRLVAADLGALPFPDRAADVVTIGYGLRNAPDLGAALEEVGRVLRHGGVLATLDFFLPPHPLWHRLFLWHLRRAGRLVGRWWHGEPHAYGYIAASLEQWMTAEAFSQCLVTHGFRMEVEIRVLAGGIGLHVVRH